MFAALIYFLTCLLTRRSAVLFSLALTTVFSISILEEFSFLAYLLGFFMFPSTFLWSIGVHGIWGGYFSFVPIFFGVLAFVWDLLAVAYDVIKLNTHFEKNL